MEENNQAEENRVRSISSSDKAYVRFLNRTHCTLEVVWVNFLGEYVRYKLLRNGEYVDVNTYKSHPWMAFDIHTKDRMLIDHEYIFMPKTFKDYFLNDNPHLKYPAVPAERRKLICITLPLYSLRYRTLLAVRNFFKTADEINQLDLPQSLSDDLKTVINLRNRHYSTPLITVP